MNRPMIAAIVMATLLLVYVGFTANYAWILLRDDSPIAVAMGAALIVFPILGVWGLVSEMSFAIRSQKLTMALEKEGLLPTEDFPTTISGRPDRSAAEDLFPRYAAEVQATPTSWRAWLRLGLAYDACGDRRRARWAVRKAISLSAATAKS
jgi:hypothetical protein